MAETVPTYSILMVVHNGRTMVQLATLRTLRHIRGQDARLVVVDNASTDGVSTWLSMLARRGDIDLINSQTNIGHGPALERARHATKSPYLVTLDSDAFPLTDDWLAQLRSRLNDNVRASGIRHYRGHVHPACMMIARQTLDEIDVTFLGGRWPAGHFDVGERISFELKQRGWGIAGLELTNAQRRASISEPTYLGAEYEGLVYHQWYTTRSAIAAGRRVDDVPQAAIDRSLEELFAAYHAEPRDVTVVVGIRAGQQQVQRLRNARMCLQALNQQNLERWRYRIIVVEQDDAPRLEAQVGPLADHYLFAYNLGAYNRGWGFNIGAMQPGADQGALCLIDADLLVPSDFLQRGLQALSRGARAVIPYREIIYLDTAATDQVISTWEATAKVELHLKKHGSRLYSGAVGGCIWVDGAYYRASGGHNEEFRDWGAEDREFYNRLNRDTPVERLPGRIYHLEHPRAVVRAHVDRSNQALFTRLADNGYPPPSSQMGDLRRYEAERSSTGSAPSQVRREHVRALTVTSELGQRAWEHWHRWSEERIDRIVTRERTRDPSRSVRSQLADLLVRRHSILLDVGCGPGALWVHLERHRPRYSWVGVDATAKMVEAARRFFPSVEVRHADAAALPFAERSFDAVLLRHVLEYLPHPLMTAAVAEATRVARGMVVLSFYAPPRKTGPSRSDRVGRGFVETRWAAAEITAVITRSGWRIGERLVLSDDQDRDEVWLLYAKG